MIQDIRKIKRFTGNKLSADYVIITQYLKNGTWIDFPSDDSAIWETEEEHKKFNQARINSNWR